LRNPSDQPQARSFPPDSACGKALPLALPFPCTFVGVREPGRFVWQHRPGYSLERGGPFPSAGGGGVHFPALSTEKSVPYGSKRNVLAPGPWQSTRKKLGVGRGRMDLTGNSDKCKYFQIRRLFPGFRIKANRRIDRIATIGEPPLDPGH